MGKNKGVMDVINRVRKRIDLEEPWANHLGNIPHNFRMLIEGKPGHGKTSYTIQLTKMLANKWGKVYFNSSEEGDVTSMAETLIRFSMDEVNGKWILAREEDSLFDKMMENLSRPNSGRIIVIDSLDYMHLTFEQYQALSKRFKNKAIIVICWSDPMDINAKRIRYHCPIKVEVTNFVAKVRSRFGGNKPYTIWDNPTFTPQSRQLTLFKYV